MEYFRIQETLISIINSTVDDNGYRLENIDARDLVKAEYIALKFGLSPMLAKDIYAKNPKKAELLFFSAMSGVVRTNTGLYKGFDEAFLRERFSEYAGIHEADEFTAAFFRHLGFSSIPTGFETFALDCFKEMQEKMSHEVGYDNLEKMAKKSGGCYIATAIYGSYDCPNVWVLRRFKDEFLDKSILGRAFIKLYYSISPTLVKKYGNALWFGALLKKPLDCFVSLLRNLGFTDKPYMDK